MKSITYKEAKEKFMEGLDLIIKEQKEERLQEQVRKILHSDATIDYITQIAKETAEKEVQSVKGVITRTFQHDRKRMDETERRISLVEQTSHNHPDEPKTYYSRHIGQPYAAHILREFIDSRSATWCQHEKDSIQDFLSWLENKYKISKI